MIVKRNWKMIEASPHISNKFKVIKSEVTCLLNNSKMIALATSDNRMDGRKANVFVADETLGHLKTDIQLIQWNHLK
ncbi:terminase large subunit [Staphylococcus phage S-CoN_Ph17]|nr:terminase large subunit [Staphylococcus phage S-CoN_Ph17]